MSLHLVKAFG